MDWASYPHTIFPNIVASNLYIFLPAMQKKQYLFYLLSFLEGASVMAAELLGAKMLAPFFGSSLYVWSSVLGITLGGLAMGYFAGGILSGKKNAERNLFYILLASAVFLMVMPILAKTVMVHTSGLSLLVSILFSSLIFLFPPVFFMGMVSPMIIRCVSAAGNNSAQAAGTVFAVSTVGGILSTFLLGFYFIPNFGLTNSAVVAGILLGILPFMLLITSRKFFSLLFLPMAFFSLNSSKVIVPNSDVAILYASEGLLGQVIVADYPTYDSLNRPEGYQRILFVNRSTQTVVTYRGKELHLFEYVDVISKRTTDLKFIHSSAPRALVLGLGGGSVADELVKNGFAVDAVELDERMALVAKKYFNLDEKVNVSLDDARHFVISHKSSSSPSEKYDVIVLDAFIGEVNPHHLFTQEFFAEVKTLLTDKGLFFINGHGYWNGEAGQGMRSVGKTLMHSGFDVEAIPTGTEEDYRNLVLVAASSSNPHLAVTPDLNPSLEDALVLSDDKPQLEILNAQASKRWREGCMRYFLSGYYSKRDVLIFK